MRSRRKNQIKSKARYDCVSYTDLVTGGYDGLNAFVNADEQLALYKVKYNGILGTHYNYISEWSLGNHELILSNIYIEDTDFPEFGYGYPDANRLLDNGGLNPLFQYRNDGYLYLINNDYTVIEVLAIPGARNLILGYYQQLIDGVLNDEVNSLRSQAKPFHHYSGFDL